MSHRTIGTSIQIHVELYVMDTSRLGQAMHKAEAAFPISPSSYRPIKVAVKERFLSCVTPTPASVELHQSCLLDYSLLPISRPKRA
jgi:hypothetical protein